MNDRNILVFGLLCFLIAGVAVLVFFKFKDDPVPAIPPPEVKPAIVPLPRPAPVSQPTYEKDTSGTSCGRVSLECEAYVQVQELSCIRKRAVAKAEKQLIAPLKANGCDDAENRIAARCPEGCRFDYRTLLTIPNKTTFRFTPKTEQNAACSLVARKKVSLSGECR